MRARCHQRPARLAVFCLAALGLLVTATWARADDPAVRDRVAGLRTANQPGRAIPERTAEAARCRPALPRPSGGSPRPGRGERRGEGRSARRRESRSTSRARLSGGAGAARNPAASSTSRETSTRSPCFSAQNPWTRSSRLDGLNRLATRTRRSSPSSRTPSSRSEPASQRLADREAELTGSAADAHVTRASLVAARDARRLPRQPAPPAATESEPDRRTSPPRPRASDHPPSSPGGTGVPPTPSCSRTKMTVSSTGYA